MDGEKTFINRLTKKQIESFIKAYYLSEEFSFDFGYSNGFLAVFVLIGDKYSIHNKHFVHFYDFYAEEHLIGWTHFLHKIFGDEYKEAFIKHYLE